MKVLSCVRAADKRTWSESGSNKPAGQAEERGVLSKRISYKVHQCSEQLARVLFEFAEEDNQLPNYYTSKAVGDEAEMEVIIAYREEHRRTLHPEGEQADEEEEDSYYATAALREEDDEYFEATGSRQDHQKERGVTAAVEEDFRDTVGQLNEFNNSFLENMKETFQRKSNEVRALRALL